MYHKKTLLINKIFKNNETKEEITNFKEYPCKNLNYDFLALIPYLSLIYFHNLISQRYLVKSEQRVVSISCFHITGMLGDDTLLNIQKWYVKEKS